MLKQIYCADVENQMFEKSQGNHMYGMHYLLNHAQVHVANDFGMKIAFSLLTLKLGL